MEILIIIGLLVWVIRLELKFRKVRAILIQILNGKSIEDIRKELEQPNNTSEEEIENIENESEALPWEDEPIETTETHTKKAKEETAFSLEEFLGKKFFAVLGIISIVFAIGFFTMWAFSHNLIGPTGRIAIGILFSLVILGLGEFLRPKYPKFSPVILSAGIAGLIITTFVARNVYDFLSADQSFIAYIIEVSTGLFLALKNNSRTLGNFSIIGGLLSPILIQSPEANALGLLTFLSILSIAGFIISTQKKWSEIIGILFLGVTAFEIVIIMENDFPKESPILFLSFIFGLHVLLGSGGIIRCVYEKTQQKISEISSTEVFELLVFIVSVLTANFLAGAIFDEQAWKHFGFFVLFQGFLLWGLSEYLKTKGIEIFQKITLASTMASIIFATIWEIGVENEILLTTLLSIEGILFCFAGKNLKDKLFEFFGQCAIFIALLFFMNLGHNIEFLNISIATLILILAFLYSINPNSKKIPDTLWNGVSILVVSGLILFWNFEEFDDQVSNKMKFLTYIIPIIWSLLLSYSLIKIKKLSVSIFGILFLILLNFIAFGCYSNDQIKISNFILLILILISNFTALAPFFIKDKALDISQTTKKIMTILILGISTFSIFVFGIENLKEPIRTIFWLIWGITLFGFGIKNNWARFRYFGIGIFCFIIAKLYLNDIWKFETWIRFFAFLTLGVSLLGISFLYAKKDKKHE